MGHALMNNIYINGLMQEKIGYVVRMTEMNIVLVLYFYNLNASKCSF